MNSRITDTGSGGFKITLNDGVKIFIQFGDLVVGSGGTVTFPIPYTKWCAIIITGTSNRAGSNYTRELCPVSKSLTGFTYASVLALGSSVQWIAIGY